jgi:hypothetical protein
MQEDMNFKDKAYQLEMLDNLVARTPQVMILSSMWPHFLCDPAAVFNMLQISQYTATPYIQENLSKKGKILFDKSYWQVNNVLWHFQPQGN